MTVVTLYKCKCEVRVDSYEGEAGGMMPCEYVTMDSGTMANHLRQMHFGDIFRALVEEKKVDV